MVADSGQPLAHQAVGEADRLSARAGLRPAARPCASAPAPSLPKRPKHVEAGRFPGAVFPIHVRNAIVPEQSICTVMFRRRRRIGTATPSARASRPARQAVAVGYRVGRNSRRGVPAGPQKKRVQDTQPRARRARHGPVAERPRGSSGGWFDPRNYFMRINMLSLTLLIRSDRAKPPSGGDRRRNCGTRHVADRSGRRYGRADGGRLADQHSATCRRGAPPLARLGPVVGRAARNDLMRRRAPSRPRAEPCSTQSKTASDDVTRQDSPDARTPVNPSPLRTLNS
jgi:hypothetical protein